MSSNPESIALKTAQQSDIGAAKFGGLCTTCEHLESCCFKRSPEHPILFCEEFNASGASDTMATASDLSPITKAKDVSLYTGLCINCAHRETCVFPQIGAGGWHCEEYE